MPLLLLLLCHVCARLQAAMQGEKGPRAQQVALGSTVAAAALAITGVAVSLIFGHRRGGGSRR